MLVVPPDAQIAIPMVTARNVVLDIILQEPIVYKAHPQPNAPLNVQVAQQAIPAPPAKAPPIYFPALISALKIAHKDTSSHLMEKSVWFALQIAKPVLEDMFAQPVTQDICYFPMDM
jgi:hypothetical protein